MDLKIILAFLAIVCLTSGNPVANNPANDDGNDVTTNVGCSPGFSWCVNKKQCCPSKSICGALYPCYRDSGHHVPGPSVLSDVNNDVTTSIKCVAGFGWCGNVQKCCYLRSKCGHVSPCSGPFPEPHRSSDVNIEETYDPALDANINEKETLPFEEQIEFE